MAAVAAELAAARAARQERVLHLTDESAHRLLTLEEVKEVFPEPDQAQFGSSDEEEVEGEGRWKRPTAGPFVPRWTGAHVVEEKYIALVPKPLASSFPSDWERNQAFIFWRKNYRVHQKNFLPHVHLVAAYRLNFLEPPAFPWVREAQEARSIFPPGGEQREAAQPAAAEERVAPKRAASRAASRGERREHQWQGHRWQSDNWASSGWSAAEWRAWGEEQARREEERAEELHRQFDEIGWGTRPGPDVLPATRLQAAAPRSPDHPPPAHLLEPRSPINPPPARPSASSSSSSSRPPTAWPTPVPTVARSSTASTSSKAPPPPCPADEEENQLLRGSRDYRDPSSFGEYKPRAFELARAPPTRERSESRVRAAAPTPAIIAEEIVEDIIADDPRIGYPSDDESIVDYSPAVAPAEAAEPPIRLSIALDFHNVIQLDRILRNGEKEEYIPQAHVEAIRQLTREHEVFVYSYCGQQRSYSVRNSLDRAGITDIIGGPARVLCGYDIPSRTSHWGNNARGDFWSLGKVETALRNGIDVLVDDQRNIAEEARILQLPFIGVNTPYLHNNGIPHFGGVENLQQAVDTILRNPAQFKREPDPRAIERIEEYKARKKVQFLQEKSQQSFQEYRRAHSRGGGRR